MLTDTKWESLTSIKTEEKFAFKCELNAEASWPEIAEIMFLKILKTWLEKILSNLLKLTLLWVGELPGDIQEYFQFQLFCVYCAKTRK